MCSGESIEYFGYRKLKNCGVSQQKTVLNTRGTGRAESTQRQLYVFMALLRVSRLRVSADPQVLTDISSDSAAFEDARQLYDNALRESGFSEQVEFLESRKINSKNVRRKNRSRNIT